MKIQTKEIYKCDHCNKLYQIKRYCAEHEIICSKNPVNDRDCFGCMHLEKKETKISYDTPYGESFRTVHLLHCVKIDSFLYPPKVEHKGNMFETEPYENNPMYKQGECPIRNKENETCKVKTGNAIDFQTHSLEEMIKEFRKI